MIDVEARLEDFEKVLTKFREMKRGFFKDHTKFVEKDYDRVFELAVYPSRNNYLHLQKFQK